MHNELGVPVTNVHMEYYNLLSNEIKDYALQHHDSA